MPPRTALQRCSLLLFAGLLVRLCAVPAVYGQTATVRGFVIDENDREPLQGVNVILTNEAGALYGAATDPDGVFAIARIPAGTYRFRATFIGYQTFEDTLTVSAGELLNRNLSLRPEETEMVKSWLKVRESRSEPRL